METLQTKNTREARPAQFRRAHTIYFQARSLINIEKIAPLTRDSRSATYFIYRVEYRWNYRKRELNKTITDRSEQNFGKLKLHGVIFL